MVEFLSDYRVMLALIIGVFFYVIIRIRDVGYRSVLKEIREYAYGLMLIAEKGFESEQGKAKMEWVIDQLYMNIPRVYKYFMERDDIEALLQVFYDELKDFMDDGQLNNSTEGDH